MAWLRNIGGRLKNDYRYSIGIVYNPFPWPQLDEAAKTKLEKLAKTVLDARVAHEGATLADLYDPDVMPEDLRKAHRALDEAVDRLYRKAPCERPRKGGASLRLVRKTHRADARRRCQTQARPEKVKAGPSSLAATMAATISNELISLHAEFLEWMLALILAIN